MFTNAVFKFCSDMAWGPPHCGVLCPIDPGLVLYLQKYEILSLSTGHQKYTFQDDLPLLNKMLQLFVLKYLSNSCLLNCNCFSFCLMNDSCIIRQVYSFTQDNENGIMITRNNNESVNIYFFKWFLKTQK